MDRFNVGQLTKEMVVARLSELQDPCEAAAEIARKTLLIALENAQSLEPGHKQSIVEIAAGTMTGLLLSEQNLSHGAKYLLQRSYDVAVRLHLDPPEIMELTLRGIASMRTFSTPAQLRDIESMLAMDFMGISEVFHSICMETEPPPAQRHLAQPQK